MTDQPPQERTLDMGEKPPGKPEWLGRIARTIADALREELGITSASLGVGATDTAALGVAAALARAGIVTDQRDPAPLPAPRRFLLVRHHDVSGVSGTGVVADGVMWPDRTATIRWRSEWPSTNDYARGMDQVHHVNGHGGHTEVVWLDPNWCSDDTDPDLSRVLGRMTTVAQALLEHWDPEPTREVLEESSRDVPALVAEVQRLRRVIRAGARREQEATPPPSPTASSTGADWDIAENANRLLDIAALTNSAEHPTQAAQWAVHTQGGETEIYGDQEWVRSGRAGEECHPGGKVIHREITISYGPWRDSTGRMVREVDRG